jgi:hydrogenase maturation factor
MENSSVEKDAEFNLRHTYKRRFPVFESFWRILPQISTKSGSRVKGMFQSTGVPKSAEFNEDQSSSKKLQNCCKNIKGQKL